MTLLLTSKQCLFLETTFNVLAQPSMIRPLDCKWTSIRVSSLLYLTCWKRRSCRRSLQKDLLKPRIPEETLKKVAKKTWLTFMALMAQVHPNSEIPIKISHKLYAHKMSTWPSKTKEIVRGLWTNKNYWAKVCRIWSTRDWRTKRAKMNAKATSLLKRFNKRWKKLRTNPDIKYLIPFTVWKQSMRMVNQMWSPHLH